MRTLGSAVFVAAILVAVVPSLMTTSMQGKTVWDSVYKEEQAIRGQAFFSNNCVYCHKADLSGGEAVPALAGDRFMKSWEAFSLGDLFDAIKTTMPPNRPGSVPDPTIADVIAFLLRENKFPTGTEELKADPPLLKTILIKAK